jgi:pimeloyl-ACP methyl ester carboxylesterase
MKVEPFRIDVAEEVLDDLRERIRRTRWPDELPGVGWDHGTELAYLRDLLCYWAEAFDWRARERELNRLSHFRAQLGGLGIHFVHERGVGSDGVPLVMTHGWPSSFLEMLALVPLLTDPGAHGIDGPAFDVVIPSLPGYGFSDRPRRSGVTSRATAELWHELMRGLGYERYGAHGSDFGAGVATFMALDQPGPLIGLHLTFLEESPYAGPGSRPLSAAERSYLDDQRAWVWAERAYGEIQSTKPQTLGYGLNDSPAGLAAWILEKWRSWSDSGGDVESRFSRDLLLTNLTIYWATQTITSSTRAYLDKRRFGHDMTAQDFVAVPTAIAVFANEFVPEGTPPREWVERLYDIRRWTEMPRGGHFAALEEPGLVASDIATFFGELAGRPES